MSVRRCVVCSRRRATGGARFRECDDPRCAQLRHGTCAGRCTEVHAQGHVSRAELDLIEASFRAAWAEECAGQPWPGLEEAQRQLRARHLT
jgi:hypothetical protein